MRLSVFTFGFCALMMFPCVLRAQEAKELNQRYELIFKDMRPAERKELIDNSVETLTSGFFSQAEKDSVEIVFKRLQDLRVTANPELRNFLMCLNAFRKRDERSNLGVWLDGLKRRLATADNKRNGVRDYLVGMTPLVCELVVSSSSGHQWLVRGRAGWSGEEQIRLSFREAELVCKTPKDSIVIQKTDLSYVFGSEEIQGKGGTVRWKNTPEEISASLSAYKINTRLSEYAADSAWLDYKAKYSKPVLGRLKDNASKFNRNGKAPYPEFASYATDIKINPLFKDVAYQGGIAYAGETFSGFGSEKNPAFLCIAPGDSVEMFIHSSRFTVDSTRVMAGSASMTIAFDSGQITHPDINFLYSDVRRTVTVKRITEQSQHLAFKDSYHRILFTMEEIIWPLDSIGMEMKMSSRSGLFKATIESQNFFSDNIYDNIQGMDEINPLNGLLKCSVLLKSNTFTLSEYAEFMKKPADQLRKQVVLLSYDDFVNYDEKKDEVTLKQRLFDYTKARVGKQDYDNIRFASLPQDSRINALLDVRNFNLTIFGVDKFVISEAKDIYVQPSDKKVVMLKNRDMAFNGKLNAGMFDMYGTNLYFSYDKYTIDLNKVDSANMFMASEGAAKRGDKVKSILRDVKGDIVIGKPDNKSGKDKDPSFPMLNSRKESYVYFDDKAIQNGGYKRDSFYYVVKPYTMKGINDAANFRYAFAGRLVSNILSDITDTLRLMKDNSLGMAYKTQAGGLGFYGRGRLKGEVSLDQKGFLAKADIDINKSKFHADTVLMMPGWMTARTPLLEVAAIAGNRPGAKGENVRLKYLAQAGNLQAYSTDKSFETYEGKVKHQGNFSVYADRLDASGQLSLKDAVLQAKLFNLKDKNVLSANTSLKISALSDANIQLNTGDVKADIDMAANKGRFVNNAAANRVDFPTTRYSCSFKSFVWYMQEAYLNIGIEDENELAKIWKIEDVASIPEQGRNVFRATDRMADSLSFVAPLARYDLKTGDIACRRVNHIDVANGRFYPQEGDVYMQGQGKIKDFTAGTLLCNRADTARRLENVDFQLKGRNSFNGSGDFKYVSEEEKASTIRFSEIHSDTNRMIYANAQISPEQSFLLNEGFSYKGKVVLHSGQKNLFFKGFVDLTSGTDYLKHTWMAVNAYLDAGNVKIPVQTENRDDKQQRIFNGIFLNVDKTTRPYASFLSGRTFYNDDVLTGGQGGMVWSRTLKQYIISDTTANRYYTFRYDPGKNTVSAFDRLGIKLNAPGIGQKMAGDISYQLKEEELKMKNIFYSLDFNLVGKMEAILLKDLSDGKAKTIVAGKPLREKMYCLYGKQQMDVMNKVLDRPAGNIPDSLNQMLVLDSLCFAWNTTTKSYVSDGEAKIVAIHGKPVGKSMKMKIELARRRAGDEFFMYLYDDNRWYYFEYSDRALYTMSSNEEYNEALRTEKADKKVVRTADKEVLYTITLCPDSKRERFLKRVK